MRGRNARHQRWLEIEQQYNRPIKSVILSLRERHGWLYIAEALGVRNETLINWRKELGIEVDQASRRREG
jgi:hypothetical protein